MRVSLFGTCLMDQMYPEVGENVVQILRKYGCEVDFPMEQTCCGQPVFNSGYQEEAKAVAKQTIHVFEDANYVVSPSGSCTGMIKHYYPKLFADDAEMRLRAEQLAEKTYEFTQFLVHVLQVDLNSKHEGSVTFHPSCHALRLLRLENEPIDLLQQVEGLQYIQLPDADVCCGFGGTFAVKMGDISTAMAKEKASCVEQTGAETLVSTDLGCLLNIEGQLRRSGKTIQVKHISEILVKGVDQSDEDIKK